MVLIPKVLRPLTDPLRPYYATKKMLEGSPDVGLDFFGGFIEKDDVLVEAGANSGHLTKLLAENSRYVHAFEPSHVSFLYLKRYIKGQKNISIYNYGLADRDCVGNLRKERARHGLRSSVVGIQAAEYASVEKVKLRALDSISLDPMPTAILFDLEGYEIQAILGARNYLGKVKKIFVETHPLEDGTNTLIQVKAYLSSFFPNIQERQELDNSKIVWLFGWQ